MEDRQLPNDVSHQLLISFPRGIVFAALSVK